MLKGSKRIFWILKINIVIVQTKRMHAIHITIISLKYYYNIAKLVALYLFLFATIVKLSRASTEKELKKSSFVR